MNKLIVIGFFVLAAFGSYFYSSIKKLEVPAEVAADTQNTVPSPESKTPVTKEVAAIAQASSPVAEKAPVAPAYSTPILVDLQKGLMMDLSKEMAGFTQDSELPEQITDWSADMGQAMLEAGNDPAAASATFSFLTECTQNQKANQAFRAMCAVNAKRLADRYPSSFSAGFEKMQGELPTEISEFLANTPANF